MSGRGDTDEPLGSAPLALTLQPCTTTIADQESGLGDDAGLSGSLLVISGAPADIGTHVLVDGSVFIGREPEGMQLRDARCSRRHALVTKIGDGHWLEDQGSTNGILLNGSAVMKRAELHDGDRIRLGQTTIKFTIVDRTEAAYLRKMEVLASRDALTGLLANHRFSSLLAEAFRSAKATDVSLAVLMMDMDGLKRINDAHGHRMGAETIRQVGAIIGEELRGRGEATRFGGDEFCAFLPGAGERDARALAERLRARVEQTEFLLDGIMVKATISIGIGTIARSVREWTVLQEKADRALYRAKLAGRNRTSV